MPLGSAPTSRIDIDYIRAQGKASTGRILFQPPRQPLESTMLSNAAVAVDLCGGVGSVELVRLPVGTYKAIEQIDGLPQRTFDFTLPLGAPSVVRYEDIVNVTPVPVRFTYVAKINGISPDPTTGNIIVDVSGGEPDPHSHPSSEITDFPSTVNALVAAAIANVINSAPGTLDTLGEIAAALENNPNFATDIVALLANKAALVHTHAIADIVDLQVALALKQTTIVTRSHYITSGSISP